ncbi:MAG TPA: lyase family protein, partial [Candidatus Dormibacteraeota bacterium]|nr:lyase family protein [Candidatus Dormibacteraeota bacterium]
VAASAAVRSAAIACHKIANDIRFLGCGPRAGIGELHLPEVQPGSSIMPGKVNPVICESMLMVVARVLGNDATVAFAGATGSWLELNVMLPVAAHSLLEAIGLLGAAAGNLAHQCVAGLEATDQGPALLEQGLAICTGLVPAIGYDRAAAIAHEAYRSGRTVRAVARERTELAEAELDRLLDPQRMVEPGPAASAGG